MNAQALVSAVYNRPLKQEPPIKAKELTLLAGIGIDNDCHANPLSPRQVLITSALTYATFDLPELALRENLWLLPNNEFDAEKLQSGDTLSLADGLAELRITFQCEPCGRLNRVAPSLCRDIKGQRGYLARVVGSGTIRAGDKLYLTKNVYPPFSEDWRERVIAVARLLPKDHFLSYTNLAMLAGVANSYCRASPQLLSAHKNIPSDRIIGSSTRHLASLQEWTGRETFQPEHVP